MKRRGIVIVLDSAGIGALPDAGEFGDAGSNTLGNIYRERGRLELPNLYALGLSQIEGSALPLTYERPAGAFGRAAGKTKAKDTTSGHWELMGLIMQTPFRTFPNGFPKEFMEDFESRIGRKTICNRAASGTAVIQELGDEHALTGRPIVYTSADSVFQIAAHENVIALDELYNMCAIAREMLIGDMMVGRVIARPFEGTSGGYRRTVNRKDYALPPGRDTILDALKEKGLITAGIGKIEDIFFHRGLSKSNHTHTNPEGIDATIAMLNNESFDFLFVNLVDFDMLYGHRNDVEGYAKALEYFDGRLKEITDAMGEGDLLIITADHGCDPTTPSTDHSREYIPILAIGAHVRPGVELATRESFQDIGATIYEYLTGEIWPGAASFLKDIHF